jgi:DNA polymerase I
MKAFWDWKANYKKEAVKDSFDAMIAEFLLSQGRPVPTQELTQHQYSVQTVEDLAKKQQQKFEDAPSLETYFRTIEMEMIPVLWHIEQAGISLDVKELQKVSQQIDDAIVEAESSMKKEVGYEINLNSSTQVGEFLAGKLGVPLKKTKTGKYATNVNEISQYAEQFPFIQQLLQYRELAKLRSTYVGALIEKVSDDGRIHTSYTQVAANTGRLSSSHPNLQNIPAASSGFGQKIKSCFHAAKGNILLSFDYSQQELRIIAHLSEEDALIQAFNERKDIHTATAAQLFDVKYADVTREQRMIAKTINFGMIYGMSAFGMSSQLHIPVEDAQKFITTFYATYPKIRSYYDKYLKQGAKDGFVETMLGRRRYVFEDEKKRTIDNSMRRVLINFPVQGSAADLIKKAMITVHKEVVEKNPDCKMLLQIHDDLVFEVKSDQKVIDAVITEVKKIMCDVYPLAVPIEVDVKIGEKWGEMEKIPTV